MNTPIFIIGNPRSGTTLLRLMLTCHGSIHLPPECGFAVWLMGRYRKWEWPASEGVLNAFIAELTATRKFETWGLSAQVLMDFIMSCKPASYSALVSAIYTCHATTQGKPTARWGDKNNYYLDHITDLKSLFPQAAFVHIVRDARDVACSYKELNRRAIRSTYGPRLPDDAGEIATQWQQNISTIRRSFDTFEWENVVEIRFESLVTEPEAQLRSLCKGLREPFDAAMLDYHTANDTGGLEPREFLQWKEKTLDTPRADRADRHRQDLCREDTLAVVNVAGEALRLYGYL